MTMLSWVKAALVALVACVPSYGQGISSGTFHGPMVTAIITSGTVTALQGGTWNVTTTASTSTVISSGTVTAFQGGRWHVSVDTGSISVANVSGSTLNVNVVNQQSISGSTVTVLQGTTPWQVTGGTFAIVNTTLPVTQSGQWNTNVTTGSITAFQGGPWHASIDTGTISAAQSGPWSVSITSGQVVVTTGSITAFQGTSPWIVNTATSTIITTGTITAFQGGVWSISGSTVTAYLNGQPITVNQGTTPWNITGGTISVVGSTIAVTQSGAWHVSVDTGSITAFQGGAWTATVNTATSTIISTGSITAFQGGPWSVSVTSGNIVATVNTATSTIVSTGSITSFQGGPWHVSVDTGSISVANVAGSTLNVNVVNQISTVTVLQGTTPWQVTGGTFAIVNTTLPVTQSGQWNTNVTTGSITAFQGGSWTATVNTATSTIISTGSITAFQGGAPWLVTGGTFAIVNSTLPVTQSGAWHVSVDTGSISVSQGSPWAVSVTSGNIIVTTGSITAFQGGPWTATVNTATSTIISTGSITAFQGGAPWLVTGGTFSIVNSTISVTQSGPWHVSVDTGSITVSQGSQWSVSVTSGNIAITTGSITAFQGGPWSATVNTATSTIISTGSITVFQGTNPWNVTGGTFAIVNTTIPVTQSGDWDVGITVDNGAGIDTIVGYGVGGASVPISDLTLIPLITAKSSQPATALGVQELKDAGRQVVIVSSVGVTGVNAEALFNLTVSTAFAAASSGTTFSIPAGKVFRVQELKCIWRSTAVANSGGTCRLRVSASGACTVSSQIALAAAASTVVANALLAINFAVEGRSSPPDGLELSGTQQFCISHLDVATAPVDVILTGFQY